MENSQMPKKNQVFISYAMEDRIIVEKLYKNLEKKRIDLWWDQTNLGKEKIKHMLEYRIQLEILNSRFVILCLSENWQKKIDSELASGFVNHEFKLVQNQKRKKNTFKVITLHLDSGNYFLDDLKPDSTNKLSHGMQTCVDSISEYVIKRSIEIRLSTKDIIEHNCSNLVWEAFELQGKHEESRRLIEEALCLSPNNYDALTGKGVILNEMGRPDEAIECFKKAIKINPLCFEAWNNMSTSYYSLNRYNEAISAIDKALPLVDTVHDLWVNKCLSLIKLGEFNEALETIEVGLHRIKYNHGKSRLWNARGFTFQQRAMAGVGESSLPIVTMIEDLNYALEAYHEANRLDPEYSDPWHNIENIGDPEWYIYRSLDHYNPTFDDDQFFG